LGAKEPVEKWQYFIRKEEEKWHHGTLGSM
jgi:hypothetical protein